MNTPPTPFNRENQYDTQCVLLNPRERQYVLTMACRLGITFLQAARELVREKQEATRRHNEVR